MSVCALVFTVCIMTNIYKYARLYLNGGLKENSPLHLDTDQAHYLRNVLRKAVGDKIRVFNGKDGEWLARIDTLGKKDAVLMPEECLRVQEARATGKLHLCFAPIKKHRMDFLIEKAVELGVTDFHPILTNRTENRKINEERLRAQIIEAAEQSERLDVPRLHPMEKLPVFLRAGKLDVPVYACIERAGAMPLAKVDLSRAAAFLVGPEGGFDPDEIAAIKNIKSVHPVDLGQEILRAETACLACLSYAKLSTMEQS